MNKQRYLAELQQLLVFMTGEDRSLVLRHYSDIFDAAGEDQAANVAKALGSPTRSAIALSRGYEPGSVKNLPEAPAFARVPKAALTDLEEDPWGDLPTFDLAGDAGEPVPEAAPETPETPEDGGEPRWERDLSIRPAEPVVEAPEATFYVERSMPLGLGIVLLVLVMAAIGVPLAAAALILAAVCLVPGCAVIFGAYLIAVGGLWCKAYLADAALLIGAALLVLALGLLVLMGGLWLAVQLIRLYVRGVRWLCGELLGKKVSDDE